VTGSAPGGAPVITLSGHALAIGLGSPPTVLDSGATVTDSSPQGFNGGTLTVSMASGGTADDRLSILNQGNGPGQIGFNGSGVWYGYTRIGTMSLTSGPATLSVALNAAATEAAVQALLADVTYQDVATAPTTAPRFVRFGIVDGAGLASNLAIETVVNSGLAPPSPPILIPPPVPAPTPTPTGPPPQQPGPPAPVSSPAQGTPPPAPSPVATGTRKKPHAVPKQRDHKPTPTTHHRPRPAGHRTGTARRLVRDRRGHGGRRPGSG
jgi:hypothetical protein